MTGLLILSLLLFIFILWYRVQNDVIIKRSILTTNECKHIIQVAKKQKWDTYPDQVDLKPVHEIDIYDTEIEGVILNKELWEISKNIYDVHLKKDFPEPDYVFLRRYRVGERPSLPVHLDSNDTTVIFLLSDPRDFKGSDLYVFDKKFTEKYSYIGDRSPEDKDRFISHIKKLPIVNLNRGDMVSYRGKSHLHGVTPIVEGERYSLSFFFEQHKDK